MFKSISKSISNIIKAFVNNRFPPPAIPNPLHCPIVTYDMPEEQTDGIYRWISNAHAGQDPSCSRDVQPGPTHPTLKTNPLAEVAEKGRNLGQHQ
jgi:hypothetical protein